MKTPGERIREERIRLKWSVQKLANEISKIKGDSISRAAVSLWEIGSSKTQKPENLFAAAQALSLNPKWVLDESGDKYVAAPPASAMQLVRDPILDDLAVLSQLEAQIFRLQIQRAADIERDKQKAAQAAKQHEESFQRDDKPGDNSHPELGRTSY